ncbi:MAG: hypothetical protein JWO19_5302, partial [Bryobacterales bacterium]|nr:hypothetical protein [Bryobacterales bacterium]
ALRVERSAPCQLGSSIYETGAAISNAAFGAEIGVSASPTHAVTRTRRSSEIMLFHLDSATRPLMNSKLLDRGAAAHKVGR